MPVIIISLLALFLWLYNNTGLCNNKTARKVMKYILLILRDKEYINNYYPELATWTKSNKMKEYGRDKRKGKKQ